MKSVGRTIKIIILLLILAVALAFIFRFWLHSYYPKEMRGLIPTDVVREAYAKGGLEAKTQEIRISYEDPEEGLEIL